VLFAPKYGVLAQALRNLSLSLRIIREDILARLYKLEEAHAAGDVAAVARLEEEARRASSGLAGWLAWRWLRWQGLTVRGPQLAPAGRELARRRGS